MSNATTEHDDVHLLIGAYAIDAVDDLERARFERHLANCADCTIELRELADTGARIGAAEVATVPIAMREAVFARIQTTPQVVPGSDRLIAAPAPSRSRWALRALGATAAVLGIGAASFGALAYTQSQEIQTLSADGEIMSSIVNSPDLQTKAMPMDGATSTIMMSPTVGKAMMVASGVPAPPAGKTYELWTITSDGTARPAGTWAPGPHGGAAVPIDGDLATTTAVAVTVEPKGGSTTPTTAPIAKVTMA